MDTLNIVSVPVPSDRLQEVYALLAIDRPEQGSQSESVTAVSDSPLVSGTATPEVEASPTNTEDMIQVIASGMVLGQDWKESEIRRLYIQSNPNQRKVLDYLATHAAGRPVTTGQIAKSLKLQRGPRSLAGVIGGIARRAHNRHGSESMPWVSRQQFLDDDDPSKGTETAFLLSPATAEVIKNTKASLNN